MNVKVTILAGIALILPALGEGASAQPSRLDVIKSRGVLRCGVNPNFAGFALPDNAGQWRGFDVDMCRAVAAAVLGPVPADPLRMTEPRVVRLRGRPQSRSVRVDGGHRRGPPQCSPTPRHTRARPGRGELGRVLEK